MVKTKLALGQPRRAFNANIIPFLKVDYDPKKSLNRHILDIRYTLQGLYEGRRCVQSAMKKRKQILIIGTESTPIADYPVFMLSCWVKRIAQYLSIWYVNTYWAAGLLTNYSNVKFAVKKYCNLCSCLLTTTVGIRKFIHLQIRYEGLVKLVLTLGKEIDHQVLSNETIYTFMRDLPDLVILFHSYHDVLAITECYKMGIFIVAVLDTHCDPTNIKVPIISGMHSGVIINTFCNLLIEGIKFKK
jgi:small subunit ribosomal protein S2